MNAKGEFGSDAQAQCEYAFDNIKAVLRDANMGIEDLVKVRHRSSRHRQRWRPFNLRTLDPFLLAASAF